MWFIYGIMTDIWYITALNVLHITVNSSSLILYLVFNLKNHPSPTTSTITRLMSRTAL